MTTGIGTPPIGFPTTQTPTQTTASYDPTSISSLPPTQVSLSKVAPPSITGNPNPFSESKLAVTPSLQSVDLSTVTNPKIGVEIPSHHLLNLGKDTGKFSTLDIKSLPPSSNNILSLQGIDPQAPQTLSTTSITPETLPTVTPPNTELEKVRALKGQIDQTTEITQMFQSLTPNRTTST